MERPDRRPDETAKPETLEAPRSRRSVLAGAIAAAAGAIGVSLARPAEADAVDGGLVVIGKDNSSSSTTALYMVPSDVTTAAEGFRVKSNSQNGDVIHGQSTYSTGRSVGVRGLSYGESGAGVVGQNDNSSAGLYGWSRASGTFGSRPTPPKKTGVYGLATQDAAALGVMGESSAGIGVKGKATNGTGVYGTSDTGYGVFGYSRAATAAYFATSTPTTGVALQTVGRVKLDKSAGLASIAAGAASVVVTPGIDVVASSAVVATLQGSAGGATVSHVVLDTTNNRFTIFLTRSTPSLVKVAWHVFG